jgi:hypothetical protein
MGREYLLSDFLQSFDKSVIRWPVVYWHEASLHDCHKVVRFLLGKFSFHSVSTFRNCGLSCVYPALDSIVHS